MYKVFDYKCLDCGEEFESLVKKYDEIPKCKCHSNNVVKLVCKPNYFMLKGSGFYKSGYNK